MDDTKDEKSSSIPPTVDSLKEQGNVAMKNGKYDEAMLHYTHAIKKDPKNYALYSNRSYAFLKLKQYILAMEDAKQTINLNPDWAKGYFRLGEVEYATENYAGAEKSYEIAMRLKPDEAIIYESIERARRAKIKEQTRDAQIPWVGAGIGIVFGVVILIIDYVCTDNPTHPLIMAFATIAISLIGYIVALIVRASRKASKTALDESNAMFDETYNENEEELEDEKENGRTRNRYTKSQARMRFKKGKL